MAKRPGSRQFWETAKRNNVSYLIYYNRLVELAISMFEWKNLPDSVDLRYLELALFKDGHAVFFKDEVMGELCLRGMISGELDVYGIPTKRTAYANNGYQRHLTDEDSVIIYNNYLHTGSMGQIEEFAKRLYNLDRTIDVNANAQKTPVLILCDEKERLTMKNLYMEYAGNEPFIFGNKQLNPNNIRVLNTDAPYVSDKLYTLKTQIWNEALTYLGISNTNQTKKERLIQDEVVRNMGSTIASRYSRLQSRREAAEKINKMFGLNIEVNYRADYREADDELMLTGQTEEMKAVEMITDIHTDAPDNVPMEKKKRNE